MAHVRAMYSHRLTSLTHFHFVSVSSVCSSWHWQNDRLELFVSMNGVAVDCAPGALCFISCEMGCGGRRSWLLSKMNKITVGGFC